MVIITAQGRTIGRLGTPEPSGLYSVYVDDARGRREPTHAVVDLRPDRVDGHLRQLHAAGTLKIGEVCRVVLFPSDEWEGTVGQLLNGKFALPDSGSTQPRVADHSVQGDRTWPWMTPSGSHRSRR